MRESFISPRIASLELTILRSRNNSKLGTHHGMQPLRSAPGAIEARARNLRGEEVAEPPIPAPARPDYAPAVPLRAVGFPPAFRVGERVRAKDMSPPGHTRLPGYIRGHIGVVEVIQPAAVLPDTNADFLGENAQHVYSVRFESGELCGARAEPFAVTAELYESYLETTS